MSYKLLKQLKEAGFPQNEDKLQPFFYPTGEGNSSGKFEMLYDPTTDELIEELGDDFRSLVNCYEGEWKTNISIDYLENRGASSGNSPKEALIKLYIKSQKTREPT